MQTSLRVNLIGSGNVASQLAYALSVCVDALGIYSPHLRHAEELAARMRARRLNLQQLTTTSNLAILPAADVYILSVKDAVLEDVASQLREVLPDRVATNSLFLHTAGCVPLDVLSKHFPHSAVMYPLQTFSKDASLDFSAIPLFIEGSNADADRRATEFARRFSQRVSHLDGEGRRRLHLAGVLANNFTNHLIALAYDWLDQSGISPECLLPIIDETARKLHEMLPQQAQTGPAVRWDENVMASHKALLADHPQLLAIYGLFSRSIHEHTTHDR